MRGLAAGIEKSRGLVAKAVSRVASDMVLNPKLGALDADGLSYSGRNSRGQESSTGLAAAITQAMKDMSGNAGDIVIPVYLGGNLLDEVIINAQQRANLRSGGR